MPRRKEITEILDLMKNTENIRNIGLVGHIDHGKTTLSDSLLSQAGLLSPELAGEARALDYLEEEQKRGITMKSTNISLYYEKNSKEKELYLVNLVDTPGHLDFSGKVTRALRLIDGVIVVVDAVEEIIAQSETVIKQALQEGVRPILFINKVDRLIRELKLTDESIRKKYTRIINDFNKLIERHAGTPFNNQWKVSPADGNVAFGSALHKWGFTLDILEKNTLKFKDIRSRYKKETYNKESYSDLAVYFPIHEAILEMVIKHLPNPKIAQKYRIKKIWKGDLNSDVGKAMLECNPKEPLIICLSKVQADKTRHVATGRIFSGTCSKSQEVYLLNENKNERIQNIALFMGQRRVKIDQLPVGNIIAIEGLKRVKSGDTLIDQKYRDKMIPFENVKYISTPVVTVSIELEYLRDLEKMKELVENLLIEDPNLRFEIKEENGEYLLSGTGPLHLEVTADEISKRGVIVSISEPRAVFKESCKSSSSLITVKSGDAQNYLEVTVSHLDPKTIKFFQENDYIAVKSQEYLKLILKEKTGLSDEDIGNFWKCDDDKNLIIYKGKKQLNLFYKNLLLDIFDEIRLNGPLCGESLAEVKIIINELKLTTINEENAFSELSAMLYRAIKEGLNEGGLILLEPIYTTYIQISPLYIKSVHSLFSKYSAKIKKINHEDEFQATIEILIPVRNSLKFAEDIRSLTSGNAFWQNEFHSYMEIPAHDSNAIVADLKFLKGLSW